MSIRTDIDTAEDLPIRKVHIPEWNTHVNVRGQTSGEDDAYSNKQMKSGVNKKGLDKVDIVANSALKVAQCIVDDEGKRIYQDHEASLLAKKSSKVINRIVTIINELNGTPEDDIENLDKAQPSDSDSV